jgi:geranylgeranyl diphosphate synthase type I
MASYSPTLDELRGEIDRTLEEFLSGCGREVSENADLIDELVRVVSAGGKRLRPAFCYWGGRAAGAPHGTDIVTAAASLELLHTFALVHDDIMDASDERRGAPTVHALHGVSVAVLAGDLALVLADSCFFSAGFSGERLRAGLDAYLTMRQEVIAGQYLDLRAASDRFVDEGRARRIAVLKSGRYSVEKPLVIGARLGGAGDELIAHLSRFGELVGEAFQFRDDLLGTFGDRSVLGKPIDSDIREGKRNLLYARTASSLRGKERDFFVAHWGAGAGLSASDVEALRELVERSGARAHVEGLARDLGGRAVESLDRAELNASCHDALADLADIAVNRRT